MTYPSPKPDWVALAGILICIVLHIILDADKPCLPFVVSACLGWTVYIALRVWQDRHVLAEWGFRTDNLLAAAKPSLVLLAATVVGLAALGAYRGTLRFPPHLAFLLLLYPLWGVIQQFLALGIVVANLERLLSLHDRKRLIALVTATIFALVHLNDWRVATATFWLELAFVALYFRERNVLPLAVAHGWLGTLFYLWVLDVDLWMQTFG